MLRIHFHIDDGSQAFNSPTKEISGARMGLVKIYAISLRVTNVYRWREKNKIILYVSN